MAIFGEVKEAKVDCEEETGVSRRKTSSKSLLLRVKRSLLPAEKQGRVRSLNRMEMFYRPR